jgi:MtrB/PioB family decaheme-associated outer membrane protein
METRKMKIFGCVFQPALILLVLLLQPALYAQDEDPKHGSLEIGVRALVGDHGSSQFNEYRDLTPGFFVQRFEANLADLFSKKYFLNLQTRETLRKDSAYRLAAGQYGRYRIEFKWDDTPHVFTNSATILFVESSPGVFTIPSPTRANLLANPASLPQVLAGAPALDSSLARKLGSLTFTYTPTADWTFQLQYSREKQQGFRPLGTTTNTFANLLELPEPIDYRNQQAKASAEYGVDRGGFQASYSTSIFSNEVGALVWDNAFRTTDAAGAGSRGRMALYPDNSAQALDFAGAFNLNSFTRVMASVTPEWMRQNDAFLPMTINSAITGVPQLPASSLNGKKQTLAMNYTLTSRPLPAVELTARYRSYEYSNDSPSLLFSDYVQTDYRLQGLARRSLPYGYNSQHVELDASWQFLKGQSLKLGYDWGKLDRQHRDVAQSTENTGSVGLDLNPKKWINLRASYKHAEREPQLYLLNQESYPLGGDIQFQDMQRFDEAARTQDRADALLQMNAGDRLTFSASYGTTQDRYHGTVYGLSRYKTIDYTADLAYQLTSDISVFADYTHEQDRSDQRSSANNSSNNNWESYISDVVHTVGGGISASRLHQKVTLDAFYSLSFAKGNIATRALGSAAIPGFLLTTAQNYPETSNRFHQVTVDVRYHLRPNVTPKLEYRYERFANTDFQTSPMMPNMVPIDPGTNTSLFLGVTVPGYAVHIVSAALEYRF